VIDSKDSVTVVPRKQRTEDSKQTPVLILVGAADSAVLPSQRLVIFDEELVIGRKSPHPTGTLGRTALVLRDRMISGQHAVIRRHEGGFELTDLESTNGTVVDGFPAQPTVKLREGSLIFVGAHVAVFRLLTPPEAAAIFAELEEPLGPVPSCNAAFAMACAKMRKLAPTDAEMLLTGETGVGKEVYAQSLHIASRRKGRMVAINCAAIPRELVESELFGYVRGAHSQASVAKAGLIEEAEGGTLFLDEIGDMSPELQTKLLRFTQDRLLIPVGGTRPRRMDVRVLAATSRTAPPPAAGGPGLRSDLAARLGAEPIRIPPLRERPEDIAALSAFILGDRWRPFELAAFQALCLYTWPGNVRELEKVLTAAEALARDGERIGLEHMPAAIAALPGRVRSSPSGRTTRPPPSAAELEELMRRFNGNMMRVARELDRKPALVYRWAKRFNLNIDAYRPKND